MDGVEDCDMTNLSLGDHILKSTDLNGKYDGMSLNETNPLDQDTDAYRNAPYYKPGTPP
jgi:hypothetical protein